MHWLDDLNPQQKLAVTAPLGPVLVLAGPGSGKTRVLTYRIGYLVSQVGVRPGEVMAVTFTNKAAREMSSRVETLLDQESRAVTSRMSLGTFHALAARILRRESSHLPFTRQFVIFDESDQRSLMRQVLKEFNLDPKKTPPSKVLNAVSAAKNELIEADSYSADSYFGEIVRRAYRRYQERLLQNNAVDFDDLLMWAAQLLQRDEALRARYRRQYAHILVDEFQDTNSAQYVLLRLLAGEQPHLFVVGDPDQSIYRWRGADYRNILRFQEDYPQAQTVLLEQNYRSTQRILDVAMAIIDRHPGRTRKKLFTERGQGLRVVVQEAYDENEEARFVVDTIASLTAMGEAEPGQCAVMYRTNAQSRLLEEAFLKANLPYRLVGAQRFYGRREVKDLIAFLRLIHNPDDRLSLLRVINVPTRGIGEKTVEALLQAAQAQSLSPAEVLLDLASGKNDRFASSLNGRARSVLAPFGAMLAGWLDERDNANVLALVDRILADTHYQTYIDDGTEEGAERWGNILELRGVAFEFEDMDLTTFLEHVALISDQDTLTESQNAPTLLTLHAAKGLEFGVVFIVGLNDGWLPHQRSFEDPESMQEERRLLYVGVTRAQDRLYLLRTFRRRLFGGYEVAEPSRFLEDLPSTLIEGETSLWSNAAESTFTRQTRWEPTQPSLDQAPQYKAGMRVRHTKFGEGIVMASRLDQDDEEVTVAFEDEGIKRLVASLAKLERLDD